MTDPGRTLVPSAPTATRSVPEIAAIGDPVLRNLWITQRYHELALGLRDAGMGADATWCAFAVWASKTAGATIRGDELAAHMGILVADHSETIGHFNHGIAGVLERHLTHDHLGRAISGVVRDVSTQIAQGNLLVFRELAPLFTALLEAQRASPASPDVLTTALAPGLRALGTGTEAIPVVDAFGAYARACFGPADRPAQIFGANVLAVAHEQDRLQPAISSALAAAISDTLRRVIEDDLVPHLPSAELRATLDRFTDEVCRVLDGAWDTILTEHLMQLVTATETFDLRRDVPPLAGEQFPPALADLRGTIAEDPYGRWDQTKGTGAPSGARDWAVLEQRMNFIVNLFRSRQQDPGLFIPPFSAEQLDVLVQDRLPPGPL